jgi:hypothetical protein
MVQTVEHTISSKAHYTDYAWLQNAYELAGKIDTKE